MPRLRFGEHNGNWRGGKRNNGLYWLVYSPDHPNADKKGYVLEQRLVAEKKLGRYLEPSEVCHHINGDTKDNRSENIGVYPSQSEHCKNHQFGGLGGGCHA